MSLGLCFVTRGRGLLRTAGGHRPPALGLWPRGFAARTCQETHSGDSDGHPVRSCLSSRTPPAPPDWHKLRCDPKGPLANDGSRPVTRGIPRGSGTLCREPRWRPSGVYCSAPWTLRVWRGKRRRRTDPGGKTPRNERTPRRRQPTEPEGKRGFTIGGGGLLQSHGPVVSGAQPRRRGPGPSVPGGPSPLAPWT